MSSQGCKPSMTGRTELGRSKHVCQGIIIGAYRESGSVKVVMTLVDVQGIAVQDGLTSSWRTPQVLTLLDVPDRVRHQAL